MTMGAYDGAEVCELVENYLLYELSKLYKKMDIGLHRDWWFLRIKVVKNQKKIKKSIQSIFRENDLKVTIQCNLKIVNYLHVTINLSDTSYRPFNKTNNEINYIHKQLNYPPSII